MSNKQPPQITAIEPLLLSAAESATLLNIGRSLFYSMHSTGELGPMPVKLGRRTLWRRAELTAWVNAGCCISRDKWIEFRKEQKK